MPDPQPSAVAKRLAEVAEDARSKTGEQIIEIDSLGNVHKPWLMSVAIALDDAGVGKAVAILEGLKQETWMRSYLTGKVTSALAALAGDNDG